MGQATLTITDTTVGNEYWRRWSFATEAATTTNLTHANISTNGSSATIFKFALNPKEEPLGVGSKLVKLGLPGKNAAFYQDLGTDALTVLYNGELRNARAGTTNYDYSADATQCAIADRDCLFWAYFEAVQMTLTLSDGTVIPRMVVTKFLPRRVGSVQGGYAYDLELSQKIVTT